MVSMRQESDERHLPHAVYWIAVVAFALRLGARLCAGIAGYFDSGYRFFFDLAQSIAAGRGLAVEAPTAFRVPLYPIFLAALTLGHKAAVWPVILAQSAIGAATCLCAALLAHRMFEGPDKAKAALIAAGITAIYPYYVVHDTALQETSLFTLVTLAAVLLLWQTALSGDLLPAALSGVLLGLDVLTRATIAPFAVFAVLWMLWRRRFMQGLLCALLLGSTVTPWLWRSYRLTGSPVLSTETGLQLWKGNNGFLFHHYPEQDSDLSEYEALKSLSAEEQSELNQLSGNEELQDRWFRQRALGEMRAHPWRTVRDDMRKLMAVFGWLPVARHGRLANLMHAVSYGPVMLLGLWDMWRRRDNWRDDSLIYGLFLAFALVAAVFYGDTSHRSYLDVYWIVFVGGLLARLYRGASESSSPRVRS